MAIKSNVIPFPSIPKDDSPIVWPKHIERKHQQDMMHRDWFDFLMQSLVTPVYPHNRPAKPID